MTSAHNHLAIKTEINELWKLLSIVQDSEYRSQLADPVRVVVAAEPDDGSRSHPDEIDVVAVDVDLGKLLRGREAEIPEEREDLDGRSMPRAPFRAHRSR